MHFFDIIRMDPFAQILYEKLSRHIMLPAPYIQSFQDERGQFTFRVTFWNELDRHGLAPFRYAAAKLNRLMLASLYRGIAAEIEEAIDSQKLLDDEWVKDEDDESGITSADLVGSFLLEVVHQAMTADSSRYTGYQGDQVGLPPSIDKRQAQALANHFWAKAHSVSTSIAKNTE